MYQWDKDVDDKNSLSSSFWSDDEAQEEETVMDSNPVDDSLSLPLGTPGEKNLELNSQENFTGMVLKVESNEDDEISSSSSGSPAQSLMTSGYGTFRVEEQEVGDHRDDQTITEFYQDGQRDLSETRDEADCRSLCSFVEFDTEAIHEPDPSGPLVRLLANNKLAASVICCEDAAALEKINITDTKAEREEEQTEEEEQQNDETKSKLVEHHLHVDGDEEEETELKKHSEQEELQHLRKLSHAEDRLETDDPNDSSSNKDVKFIDSTLDFSWMTYRKMYVKEKLRQRTGRETPDRTLERYFLLVVESSLNEL